MGTQQKRSCPSVQEKAEPKKMQKFADIRPLFLYDRIVKLLVGPESECFQTHHNLVSQYAFFKAAYEGPFQESMGVLKLPEHDPGVVRFFIHWLYSGKLTGYFYPPTTVPSVSDYRKEVNAELQWDGLAPLATPARFRTTDYDDDSTACKLYDRARYRDTPFDALINLYLLAEYLQVPRLKDDIVNTLVEVYGYCSENRTGCMTMFWGWEDMERPDWVPSPVPAINTAWKSLSTESHLCELLVVLFCDNGMTDDAEQYKDLDAGFLHAAFREVQDRWTSNASTTKWLEPGVLCRYHDHDGTPCHFYEVEKAAESAEKQRRFIL
ncbi:MAG: hypothetical protein Q9169_006233 [Polycauliona sp. 2 TL-2023]